MSEYSGFKIKRTISLTPLTSVHEAVAVDGRAGRFALKIFHPPASTQARRVYAIEGWLLAAERQQQSAKKDGAVVEVLAFGRCEEGAFAVMPWQERVLEPWIKTLGQKGDTLRALAECLLNTIEKWEKETGGPHGNLKPSNIFLGRSGPLIGMTAQLSDPAFQPGAKTEALRVADFNAVGTILATVVRRRLPGAWPIEDAPEWKALGNGGKGWLDFCNYLLNPQPGEGEVTLAKARLRLKKVPKDANPVRTAMLSIAAVLVLSAIGLVGFARFGNPTYMPDQVFRLAQKVGNPQIKPEVPQAWIDLCVAWDTWLIDLQSNGPRLLQTQGLWEPNDQLRERLADFVATSRDMLPAALVPIPETANEKRLGVLANSPPLAVLDELQIPSVKARVQDAGNKLTALSTALEGWARWNQLRELKNLMDQRGFTRVATALQSRIPPARGSPGYKLDRARTITFLRELSLDSTGTLPITGRWSEITHLSADMDASGDRVQKAMPALILGRLVDMSSLGDFADSLMSPLEEMRQRRKQFLDLQVVRERFLKESPLQTETAEVTAADIPRWENELADFTLVPKTPADDPRLTPTFAESQAQMATDARDLEDAAPAGEANQPATLSASDYTRESGGLAANLRSLRDRPIVKRDLPKIVEETTTLAGAFGQLVERLKYTLSLLKPETWLAKVAQPYGTLNESQQRWAAWKQAALTGVTADALRGQANRTKFRLLRDDERAVKGWIDGLEGPTGFGALKVPDLAGTASADTATELKRLEAVLRERAATAVANAKDVVWNRGVPTPRWSESSPAVRKPLDDHSGWLVQLPEFASNLDQLSEHLTNGFGWAEGVHDIVVLLQGRAGVDELAGRPAESYAEAKQLEPLVTASDLGVLKAAAQSGGLSRRLAAWRRLDAVTGWPAGAADFDLDGGVVTAMRQLVGRDVKDEARRTSLLEEMVKGTRQRFNRAARVAARAEVQLTEMFDPDRMQRAGLTEADLDDPVAYNLALWRLKRSDWNEKNLDRLRIRRDNFVTAVRAIPNNLADQPAVSGLLTELSGIELKDDPNRVPTPSPATAGWDEELRREGLTLIATWKSGARNLRLEFSIVQSQDDTPPFYLAHRVIAVGEFLDLMNARPKERDLVKEKLPDWATKDNASKPYDVPLAWYPRAGTECKVYELNSAWIYAPTAPVLGLFNNTELYATVPQLKQAVTEKPTLKSPLQQVTPDAAKVFTEKMMGARLPTVREWRAVMQVAGATAANGFFRGPDFQKLFEFVKNYEVPGVKEGRLDWRPSSGVYYPSQAEKKKDDGQASTNAQGSSLWFRPVDEGPKAGELFINLLGNVSIFLAGEKPGKYFVAGGSVLSPPGIDFTQPQEVVAAGGMIGGTAGKTAYSDVGIRPAFDAPPGFKERFKLNRLVKDQRYLTL